MLVKRLVSRAYGILQFYALRGKLQLASKMRRLLFISEIPRGSYCYTKIGKMAKIRDSYRVNAKMCPFYQIVKADGVTVYENFAYCTFVKDYDRTLLDQQIKICGLKERLK